MEQEKKTDPKRALMRHGVATLAYRAARALHGTPAELGGFRPCESAMSCGEILSHVASLADWSWRLASGEERAPKAGPGTWQEEIERLFGALERLDAYLASEQPMAVAEEKILQGPLADALTHIGQIAMLRRMAGVPMEKQNYFRAQIHAGEISGGKNHALQPSSLNCDR